ncbi:MAG: hypothetical protein C0490_04755 [Marivirga sp.]|nr:hypothetical protein [Marivirga sp.]
MLAILTLLYLPLFIDSPKITYPELKSLIIGEKVHEGNILYIELIDSVAPLGAWFNGLMDILFGRSIIARHILAFLIIFLQASYLGIVFANKKAFAENSYIPSLVFALLFVVSFDTLSLSPELLGSGFLLPALNNLFKEIEFREQRNESIFNLGLYIGLASLFSFSYSVFLVGTLLTLIVFTRSTARKYFLLISGFLLPHILLASAYYLMDGLSSLYQFYYIPNLSFNSESYISNSSLWVLFSLPLFFLLISFVMMNRDARLSKYQTQLVQTMFFWLIFSVFQVLYSKDFRPQNFISVIPGISFFITHFLLLIRRKRLAEIYVWILLVGTVTVSYMARYGVITSVDYTKLFVPEKEFPVKGKRVLVLDSQWGVYKNNSMATPFLNWALSEDIFSHPEYFENQISVYDGLVNDPPDVILDKNDLLKPFLQRIPQLRKLYVRNGIYYNKREISN